MTLGMLIVSCSQAILMANHSWRMYQIGFWLRSSLISTIYRKSLTISPQGKKDSTVGEVVNLMSVDVEKLFQLMVSIKNISWVVESLIWVQKLAPFILSNDLSIGSTETKYIKLNTKTQFFKNNIRLLYTF